MPPTPIAPEDFGRHSAYDLLCAAARGHVAIDHRFLHAVLDEPERTRADLIRFANEDHSEDRVDLGVDLVGIFAAMPTAEALPFLMREIERFPDDIPDQMVEVLARIGAPALEPLLGVKAAPEEAGFLLAALGVRDERIVEHIRRISENNPGEAAFLFEIYGDPSTRPLVEALRDRAPEEVESAIAALEAEKTGGPEGLEPFDVFRWYPETAHPDLTILPEEEVAEFLRSPCAEHRLAAVESFDHEEIGGETLATILGLARDDPEPKVRGASFDVLRDRIEKPGVVELMRERARLSELDPAELGGLVNGLAYDFDFEGFPALALRAYENPASRAKALQAMWRNLNPDFATYMPRHIDDPDPLIREAAIAGAGHFGLHAEAPRIAKYFLDPEMRHTAIYAYALAAPAKDDTLGLAQLENRIRTLAEGFSEEDEYVVRDALTLRKQIAAMRRGDTVEQSAPAAAAKSAKAGRNDPCPCGSGKKYKKCCGG